MFWFCGKESLAITLVCAFAQSYFDFHELHVCFGLRLMSSSGTSSLGAPSPRVGGVPSWLDPSAAMALSHVFAPRQLRARRAKSTVTTATGAKRESLA